MTEREPTVPASLRALLTRPGGEVLLLGHANPDGDQLGSLLGLGLALGEAGWSVIVAGPQPVPEPLRFMPGSALFQQWTAPKGPFDLVVVCDCPDPERTGRLLEGARGPATQVANIDHHPDNKRYGSLNWIDETASATGEMIYDLLEAMGLPITPDVATNLFVAIHTDTGSFRYSNTSAKALRIAAELVGRGANPARVAARLYEARRPESLALLGRLLQRIEVSSDGLMAWLALPAGSAPEGFLEAEDLVIYPRSIESVKVGILLKETGNGRVKVSLRGKGDVAVNAIAARFGGGGHVNAAGCTVVGSLEEATAKVLNAVSDALGRSAG